MGYPDDQWAVWSVPMAHPCPECGAPVRKPPANRNDPIAPCTNSEIEHLWELPDFDPPFIRTRKIVPGVEKFDPDLGGEALEGPEDYDIPTMEARGTRKPKKKKSKKKKSKGKKKSS